MSGAQPPAGSPPPHSTPPLLEARDVSKRFGSLRALDGVGLRVGHREIHAIVGENGAGKTTLMRVLYGVIAPDRGSIRIDGQPVRLRSPRDARRLGIGMVHQELALVEAMTVLENLAPAFSPQGMALRRERVAAAARRAAASAGLELPPLDAVVADLPVGVRQRLEILKALAGPTRILILDEPTATLTPAEIEALFRVLRRLRGAGTSVLFISHKLPEVLAIADRITVLRRGRVVATCHPGEVGQGELARLMVGEAASGATIPRHEAAQTPVVLELRAVAVDSSGGEPALAPLDLTVRAGEVVGIAGVDGNGQNELYETVVGLRAPTRGRIRVGTGLLATARPEAAIEAGVATIPPDRQRYGLVSEMSVWENLVLNRSLLGRLTPGSVLRPAALRAWARETVQRYRVRIPHIDAPASHLSGGNQQRLIAARALSLSPRVLVAFNPTRGLDVAASASVYAAFAELLSRGGGILLLSTDLDEILQTAHRVLVLYRGRASEIFEPPFPVARIAERMAGAGFGPAANGTAGAAVGEAP